MRIKRFKDIKEDNHNPIQHRISTEEDKIQKKVEYELEEQEMKDISDIQVDVDLNIQDIENLYKKNKHLLQ